MTQFPSPLHTDVQSIKTMGRHGDLGDTTNDWFIYVRGVDGSITALGAKADAAVVDPTVPASVVAALKGLLTNLRVSPTGLLKAEDAVAASGDSGILALAVRRDTAAADAAAGDYHSLVVDSLGRLRTFSTDSDNIVDASNATTAAYAASLVVKATAGKLWGFQGYNSLATAQFIQVHDAASLPANGAAPKIVILVGPTANFSLELGRKGRSFATGIVVCNSSTGATKSIGASDCWFDVQYV